MADLTGTTPAATYKGLLQVNDYTDGVDATAKYVQDGEGTDSALAISTDKIGIGTTNPGDKLDIASNSINFGITVTNSSGNPARLALTNTEGSATIDCNNDLLRLGNNTSEDLVIDSAGNVGIGTTSPNQKITIGFADNGTDGISFRSSTYPNLAKILAENESSSTNGNLQFHTRLAGAINEAMRIDSAGNVGIGTTNFGTNASGVIGIANATAPTSSPTNMVQLYAEVVTASSELRVRDEAGNVTTLSPHAKDAPDSLYDNGKGVDEMHRVANHYLGVITFTNVDRRNDLMQKQLNGEELPEDRTFKVTETFAEYNARTGTDLQVEDWDANQQAMADADESYVKKPKPDWLS